MGIDVKLESLERSQLFKKVKAHDFELVSFILSWRTLSA